MSQLLSTLRYGGLTKEQYTSIRDRIDEENRQVLLLYAPIGCVVFCVLLLLSYVTQGVANANQMVYASSCVAMGILTVIAHGFSKNQPFVTRLLVWAIMVVLYAFSIAVSVIHPEYPSVSAIVFLMVAPLLFVELPMRVMLVTVLAAAATCVTSMAVKPMELAIDDVWNAVSFGIVAIVTNVFLMRTKLVSLWRAQQIEYYSKFDRLTELQNRNSYEEALEGYPTSGAEVIVCLYVDANGLHEINNTQGHDAGDKMLRAVASQLRNRFGEEHVYRVGGDEFVGFVPDGTVEWTRTELEALRKQLSEDGYSVSVGVFAVTAQDADMHSLVRSAEHEMYDQKRSFYTSSGKDRRRR